MIRPFCPTLSKAFSKTFSKTFRSTLSKTLGVTPSMPNLTDVLFQGGQVVGFLLLEFEQLPQFSVGVDLLQFVDGHTDALLGSERDGQHLPRREPFSVSMSLLHESVFLFVVYITLLI